MRIRVPNYYKNFKCIGSACTDTCCAGWEVVIDEESCECYRNVEGAFGERLKSSMDVANEKTFILQNGNCPFLNAHKLCDIYTELGEDKLCSTCKTFPRFIEEYGELREIGISLSCPEATRLLLKDQKPITFELDKNSERVTTYNDLDPELFMQLISSRKIAIGILQNRTITLNHRIAILLSFTKELQEKIHKNKLPKMNDVKLKYSKENFEAQFITGFMKYKQKGAAKYKQMHSCLNIFLQLENINEGWPIMIKQIIEDLHGPSSNCETYIKQYEDFQTYYHNKMYEFEHLMIYFVFRYYLKAIYDWDVYSKVKLAVVSFLVIQEMDVARWVKQEGHFDETDQIDLMHMYSKEIEHSDYNLDKLEKLLREDMLFDYEHLMMMLLN